MDYWTFEPFIESDLGLKWVIALLALFGVFALGGGVVGALVMAANKESNLEKLAVLRSDKGGDRSGEAGLVRLISAQRNKTFLFLFISLVGMALLLTNGILDSDRRHKEAEPVDKSGQSVSESLQDYLDSEYDIEVTREGALTLYYGESPKRNGDRIIFVPENSGYVSVKYNGEIVNIKLMKYAGADDSYTIINNTTLAPLE